MAQKTFSQTATNIGEGIGGFIGGLTDPLFGSTQTNTTSVTSKPSEQKGSNTVIVIAVVASIVVIGIVAYFIFRNR